MSIQSTKFRETGIVNQYHSDAIVAVLCAQDSYALSPPKHQEGISKLQRLYRLKKSANKLNTQLAIIKHQDAAAMPRFTT